MEDTKNPLDSTHGDTGCGKLKLTVIKLTEMGKKKEKKKEKRERV